jgi:hypothetical protein
MARAINRTSLLILAISFAAGGCHENKSSPAPSAAPAPTAAPMSVASAAVPSGASEVAHGSDELSYKSKSDGLIYLWDDSLSQVVTRKRVRAGQTFSFTVSTGLARIDGQTIFQQTNSPGHKFKIYFEKEK